MSAQLASTDAHIDEGLLVTMLNESFGDRSKSPFGAAIFVLLTNDDHICEKVTSHLLHKHFSPQVSQFANHPTRSFPLQLVVIEKIKRTAKIKSTVVMVIAVGIVESLVIIRPSGLREIQRTQKATRRSTCMTNQWSLWPRVTHRLRNRRSTHAITPSVTLGPLRT